MNKLAKFAGVALAFTLALSVNVSTAGALTTAQVDSIISLLNSFGADASTIANVRASLTGGTPSTGSSSSSSSSSTCYAFSADLTMGSTGADVVALQDFLISKGYLTIPAGVSKGYFGSLTQSALVNYQAAMGISPAAGYFGPLTRANVAANCTSTSTGSTSTSTGISTTGAEGNIKDFSILGSPSNEDVDEGSSKEVFAFEFEAEDSDLEIQRVDFIFEAGSTGDSDADPWDFIESLTLKRDGDEVASMSADSKSDWSEESDENIDGASDDDSFRVRFSGVGEVVEKGDMSEWTLEVETQNVDDTDLSQNFHVALDDNGLRAVDGAGIDQYVGTADSSNDRIFTITTVDSGEVVVSEGDGVSMDDSRSVMADDNADTNGVEAIVFEARVKELEVEVKDISVSFGTLSANTGSILDVLKKAHLYYDGKKISSESFSDDDTYENIVFDDLDLSLDEGTHEFIVKVDVNDLDGTNFVEGDGFVASTTLSTWDVEDTENDDVTPTGGATSENVAFYTDGVSVELVSTSVTESTSASEDTAGSADKVKYTIVFDVTAFGDDSVFIDGDAYGTATPGLTYSAGTGDGILWSTTSDSTTGTTTVTQILTAAGTENGDRSTSGNKAFEVKVNDTRRFTLNVTLQAGIDGVAAVELTGIRWATGTSAPGDAAFDQLYTFGLEDFETDLADLDFVN